MGESPPGSPLHVPECEPPTEVGIISPGGRPRSARRSPITRESSHIGSKARSSLQDFTAGQYAGAAVPGLKPFAPSGRPLGTSRAAITLSCSADRAPRPQFTVHLASANPRGTLRLGGGFSFVLRPSSAFPRRSSAELCVSAVGSPSSSVLRPRFLGGPLRNSASRRWVFLRPPSSVLRPPRTEAQSTRTADRCWGGRWGRRCRSGCSTRRSRAWNRYR